MSSSSSSPVFNTMSHAVAKKLTRDNFHLWKAQVWPVVRGAQLTTFLDGTKEIPEEYILIEKADKQWEKVPNPEYTAWLTQDQQLLSYLNSTLSKEVLGQVTSCLTSAQVWDTVHAMYASQSRARVMHLHTKLASTRKGYQSMLSYFARMKEYANEMTAAGKKLEDDDIVSYILTGLDAEYNGLVENVSSRTDPISLSNLFAQLLAAEARIENQRQAEMSGIMNVNVIARGGGFHGGRGGRDGGRGNRGGFGRGFGCGRGSSSERPMCQICEKIDHTAGRCWKRFDRDFKLEDKSANAASNSFGSSYGVGINWYTDTGATDHIMS
jgi:hypothetical protein